MNTYFLVMNGSNEVIEVSFLFLSLYVHLPGASINYCVIHNNNNNVISNPPKLYNGQLQPMILTMDMFDLGA